MGAISHLGAVEISWAAPRFHGSVQLAQIPNPGSSSEHTSKQHSSSSLLCIDLAACSPVSGMFGSEIIAFSDDLVYGNADGGVEDRAEELPFPLLCPGEGGKESERGERRRKGQF